VTTLVGRKLYRKQDIALLYKERWKIELDFRSIKTNMGMEMLRCKSPDRVKSLSLGLPPNTPWRNFVLF
jgi:putative transposase